MERIIHMTTRPGDIIMDFFAGFSTTAHAVLNVNAGATKSRPFIMVQLPEPTKDGAKERLAGFHDLAALSRERIRRVGKRAAEAAAGAIDHGFHAFRLSQSCFASWSGSAEGSADATLISRIEAHAAHLDPQASQEDILYELFLKDGFPLTVEVATIELAGKRVYSVADGALLICLDKELNQEAIDAMADMEPSRVICLDAGFQGNDQLKANAVQTFKARARNRETAIEFRTV